MRHGKGRKGPIVAIDWRTWSRLRVDDNGIKVRNFFRTYRIAWGQVRLLTDGSVRGRRGSRWWALRIVLHDGRAITAAETSNWKTAADPAVLNAIRQAAEPYAVPAELTGMPPESRPGALTIADRGWWAWSRLHLDDDGITVVDFSRAHRIAWNEVRWFTDGSVSSRDGRRWALGIVLRDGCEFTASGTSNGTRHARAGTLTAIRQAAERHAIPAVLTGTLVQSGAPNTAGLYRYPGGKPGLREWTGTKWSPFLRMDPASSGPEGEKGPAEVWSPLPEPEQQRQWDAAASRARRARFVLACLLVATAGAAAVTLVLYAYYHSQPHPNFGAANTALAVTGYSALFSLGIWGTYTRLKKIDQAGKAAAELAGAVDSTPDALHDQGEGLLAEASLAREPSAAANAAGTARMRCLECGSEATQIYARFCARCGVPLTPQPSLPAHQRESGPSAKTIGGPGRER